MRVLDERINYGLGVFAGHTNEHHVTCLTLNKGRDLAVMATDLFLGIRTIRYPVSVYRNLPI